MLELIVKNKTLLFEIINFVNLSWSLCYLKWAQIRALQQLLSWLIESSKVKMHQLDKCLVLALHYLNSRQYCFRWGPTGNFCHFWYVSFLLFNVTQTYGTIESSSYAAKKRAARFIVARLPEAVVIGDSVDFIISNITSNFKRYIVEILRYKCPNFVLIVIGSSKLRGVLPQSFWPYRGPYKGLIIPN